MEKKSFYEQIGVAMTCRSYTEYVDMFALDEARLPNGPILDVAGGASPFTAELRHLGYEGYAADSLYNMSLDEIEEHGRKEIEVLNGKLRWFCQAISWRICNWRMEI